MASEERRVTHLTISELTDGIKATLEEVFGDIAVVGEVCDISRPQSGHVYFSLKDAGARCAAVVWRSLVARCDAAIKNGEKVVCRGRLEVYPPQGRYTFIVTSMEPYGIGAQEQAFRALQKRLAAEGLFDPARKRRLPSRVRRIAVVSSLSGAAIRDFLNILTRRTRRIDLLLVPVRVQGATAAAEIAAAVKQLGGVESLDLIVVTRGGGSAEDLAAFNDEAVARAVAASPIPTVSAIGHETDVTLCDLVADFRALTPSEAAERIAPLDETLESRLADFKRRLTRALDGRLRMGTMRLDRIAAQPLWRDPSRLVSMRRHGLEERESRLHRGLATRIRSFHERLAAAAASLENLSPLSVLARGYTLTLHSDGRLVASAEDVAIGDAITTQLAHGTIQSRVVATQGGEP